MKKLLLLLLLSTAAQAVESPCYWSGTYVRCMPAGGIFLDSGRTLTLSPDTNALHWVELKSADPMSANYAITFPPTNGADGQALQLAAGTFAWYTPFSSASFTAYKTILPMKMGANAASTANIDMGAGNPGTIDGVDFTFGGKVLLKNQTDPSENGLWDLDFTGTWTREVTMPDNASSAYSAIVPVNNGGTVNGDTIWYSRSNGDGNVPFVQIPATASNAPLTASKALVTTAASKIGTSGTSATELGYVTGVTSAIQTQIDGKVATSAIIAASKGGTGIANNDAATLTRSGNHALTFTTTNTTGVTLPTTGTLSAIAGTEELTNKTLTSPKLNENVSVTTTATKLNYLTSATGTTGTTSTNVVFSTSPTLVTPALGTPTALVLTSATGLPLTSGVTGTLPVANGGTGVTASTGTVAVVLSTSPTLVTPVLGAATATSLAFSPTTGGIIGTATNDDAGAGKVGEYLIQSRVSSSRQTITSGAAANVTATALSLTAGDWDVGAMVVFLPDTTTSITRLRLSISKTSATFSAGDTAGVPTAGEVRVDVKYAAFIPTADNITLVSPPVRVSLTGTTSIYLVADALFSVSTMQNSGSIWARRVR